MKNTELFGVSFLHCHVLLTVAKHGNISKAAEELHMTQSTVTKIIQRTEEMLRLQLFHRTNKGAELTEDGKYLVPRMSEIVRQLDADLDHLYQKKQQSKAKLSIALGNLLRGSSCFWPHVDNYQKIHSDTVLDIQGGEVWELRQMLLDDKVDIAILPEFEKVICQDNDLDWCYIQTGKIFLFHNKNHKMAEAEPKSLYEFRDETFLIADTELIKGYEDFVLGCCRQSGFQPKNIIKQQNQYMIEYLLRRDEAVLLGDEFFMMADNMPDVCATEIPNLSFGVIAIWKNHNHNPAVADFISMFM